MTNNEKGTLNRRGFLGVSAGGAALPLVAGVVSASSAAVFHATGKRIRDLPIRIENLLEV
jgi:xanthine dehydrogenase YagR molybdenum-binding subunit